MQSKDYIPPVLGTGKFAKVFLTQERLACKKPRIYDAADRNEKTYESFAREIDIHSKLNHPHIIELINYYIETSFDLKKNLSDSWLLLRCANRGDLFNALNLHRDWLSWNVYLTIMRDISAALIYLTTMRIVHADIKLENILLDFYEGKWRAMLADFGLAKQLEPGATLMIAKNSCGSPRYIAPEVIGSCLFSYPADVYSFSVVMYALFFLQLPCGDFDDLTSLVISTAAFKHVYSKDFQAKDFFQDHGIDLNKIEQSKSIDDKFQVSIPANISTEHRNILVNCLATNYSQRWTAQQLMNYLDTLDETTGRAKSSLTDTGDLLHAKRAAVADFPLSGAKHDPVSGLTFFTSKSSAHSSKESFDKKELHREAGEVIDKALFGPERKSGQPIIFFNDSLRSFELSLDSDPNKGPREVNNMCLIL